MDYSEMIQQAVDSVEDIESPSDAARKIGVSAATLTRWRDGDRATPREPVKSRLEKYVEEGLGYRNRPNRAQALIDRTANPDMMRRAEGILHFGEVAAGNLEEALQKRYDRGEIVTLAEWMVQRLVESERDRVALQRRLDKYVRDTSAADRS